jgi:hypothetical protein
MATTSARTHTQSSADNLSKEAKKASRSPLMQNFIRLGYIGRGILFAAIGFLALQVALGTPTGKAPDQAGAMGIILEQPFGKALLLVVTFGLICFSLWGFIRAVFDPLHRGEDTGGIMERIGFVVSGISYGLLVYPAIQMLQGSGGPKNQTQATRDVTAQLLSNPLGPWIVGAIGVLVIIWSIAQLRSALTREFERDFKFRKMTANEEEFAEKMGQVGIGARAFVFALIGMFFIQAAIQHDPNQAKGLDAALLSLAQWPGGLYVLAFVAAGLIVFGLYSMLCSRWLKVA